MTRKRVVVPPTKTVAAQEEKVLRRLNNLPPPAWERTVSTGSILLDLTISGGRCHEGGIPYGILMEIFGPSGAGKTALLSEMCGSAAVRGGTFDVKDPEARLDNEYSRIYGMEINKDNYSRPDTVTAVFNELWEGMSGKSPKQYHLSGVDSLAALSTQLELDKGDKMGMRRAKEFSEATRKTCRMIANNKWLIACTNQIRQGDYGEVTPGGEAIPFYSSLRLRIGPAKGGWTVDKEITHNNKKLTKVIGIRSNVYVKKSSLDEPYRDCNIYIIFGYGVHDIMTSVQFLKEVTNNTRYPVITSEVAGREQAVSYIERHGLEKELREEVIKQWNALQVAFKTKRKPKMRF